MTTIHQTRRVYSADELHRLRDTKSQPRLHEAIEELDGEDAELVKEHVLRGSKSFAARSWKSRASANSLGISSNKENRSATVSESDVHAPTGLHAPSLAAPVLGEIAPNNQALRPSIPYRLRRSPTPSLKRKKVEAIVRAHGSPTHVRVTAGGRILPSELSPLCHPRYGYSAIKTNGGLIKFAPNHPMGKSQWTQATQNGFVAQDINGRLCQIVDGTILPLKEVDGALQLFMPAPNLNITQRSSSLLGTTHSRHGQSGTQHASAGPSKLGCPPEPPASAQINALELEYSKLDHELKELDKSEVLHGRTMGKVAKEALVAKRRELVLALDNVRKALKSLRQQTPANEAVPALSAQMRPPNSPPQNRLPAFLQHKQQNTEVLSQMNQHSVYGPFYAPTQPSTFAGPYTFQPTPSPESTYSTQPWFMAPPTAVFLPPPSFDGSMSSTTLAFPELFGQIVATERPASTSARSASATAHVAALPQNDGARSVIDPQRISSPRQSCALPIKVPDHKVPLKSILNPMSPAYKPGTEAEQADVPPKQALKDRAPTPLYPLHQGKPIHSSSSYRATNVSDDTFNTAKDTAHLHSSSVSSFETADFFPRNTREYSTRKHAYPVTAGTLEDKENSMPHRQDSKTGELSDHFDVVIVSPPFGSGPGHLSPHDGSLQSPSAPPGTPAELDTIANSKSSPLGLTSAMQKFAVVDNSILTDREKHNLSPKAKRQDWRFIEEHPEVDLDQACSSPDKMASCQDEAATSTSTDTMDFSKKPREWIEGYQAGLNRQPVGTQRVGEFLDGYCSGLLKSKPVSNDPSLGSSSKSASRRPTPTPTQIRPPNNVAQVGRITAPVRPTLPPLELNKHSLDTLKQAVFAPQNEHALLTPAADGPHVSEAPFNLGSWARNHTSTPKPGDVSSSIQVRDRTSSMLQRQLNAPERRPSVIQNNAPITADISLSVPVQSLSHEFPSPSHLPPLPLSPVITTHNTAPSGAMSGAHRISSITSVASSFYPGYRVISPHLEWKSASSVAHHAGLASGLFASSESTGSPPVQGPTPCPTNSAMYQHSRFKEGSLDGITSSPTSPEPPMSPTISPRKRTAKDSSPAKTGSSPARTKFEHIAEKVGIKAVASSKEKDTSEPTSPQGKRRWRDVWRGSSRKDASKDEET